MRKSLHILTLALLLTAIAPLAVADDEPAGGASGVVNINTADATQLALLPRVGEKTAERIIAWRKENGGFKKTSDLMQVKGVGAKSFELLSPYITVEGKTTLSTKVKSPRKPRAKKPAPAASN